MCSLSTDNCHTIMYLIHTIHKHYRLPITLAGYEVISLHVSYTDALTAAALHPSHATCKQSVSQTAIVYVTPGTEALSLAPCANNSDAAGCCYRLSGANTPTPFLPFCPLCLHRL